MKTTTQTKIRRTGLLLAVIVLVLASITFTLSEDLSGNQQKLLYLSVEKPYYDLGEKVTFIITAESLKDYSLSIRSESKFYKYSGELISSVDFYPKEKGMHTAELTFVPKNQIQDSLSFVVGKPENNEGNESNWSNENIENASEETNTTQNASQNASTVEVTDTGTGTKQIITDKSQYLIGETATASVNVPNQEDYKLYYEYSNFIQRYMGDFVSISFIPRGIGTHYLVLKDLNNVELERASFEIIDSTAPTTPITPTIPTNVPSSNESPASQLITGIQEPQIGDLGYASQKILNIIDSKGRYKKAALRMYDSQNNEINTSTYTGLVANRIIANVAEITPGTQAFNKLVLRNLAFDYQNNSSNLSLGIDDLALSQVKLGQLGKNHVLKAFAIDASKLNFTNGTITATAKGTELWKCKNWSFETQQCLGSWEKMMDLTPGQNYEFEISPEDPGYAETGVTTVNTRKPIYWPNEPAELIMVVLDTEGHLVDNANVTLYITSPDNTTTVLTTYLGSVTETSRGIYEASYAATALEGNYILLINAIGAKVNSTMKSYFTVLAYYEFDIIRNIPVTVDPWQGAFLSTITITSHTSTATPDAPDTFNFTEVLPSSFEVTDSGGAIVTTSTVDNTTYLTWAGLANNSAVSYSAQPPLTTPDLQELGPCFVSYADNTAQTNTTNYINSVFYEARPWYLAIDPINRSGDLSSTIYNKGNSTTFVTGRKSPFNTSVLVGGWNNPTYMYADDSARSNVSTSGNTTRWYSFTLSIPAGNSTSNITINGVQVEIQCNANRSRGYKNVLINISNNNGTTWSGFGNGTSLNMTNITDTNMTIGNLSSLWGLTWNYTNINLTSVALRANISGGPVTILCDALWININYTVSDYDRNKTLTYYNMTTGLGTVPNITKVNITINVTQYINTSSVAKNSNMPNLYITVYNGTSYIPIGLLNPTGTGLFSITTAESTILAAWKNTYNRNISVEAVYLDGPVSNSTTYDIINYTDVWITLNYTMLPTISINTSLDGLFTQNQQPNVNFNFTDPDSTTANCTLYFNDVAYGSNASTINNTRTNITANSALSEDNYTVYVNCTNAWGIVGKSSAIHIIIDVTGPSLIQTTSPLRDAFLSDTTPSFLFTAADNLDLVLNCSVSVNGVYTGNNASTLNNTQTNITSSALSEGRYDWSINCTDSAGNGASSSEKIFYIDITAPTVNINLSLDETFTQNTMPSVDFNQTDNMASHTNCTLYFNNVPYNFTPRVLNNSQNTLTVNTTLSSANYSVYVNCTDNATNIGKSSIIHIIVDTITPQVNAIIPANNNLTSNTQPNFFFNFTDSLSLHANCTLYVGTSNLGSNASVNNYTSTNITANSAITDGTYLWNITCLDLAGNSAGSANRNITIDTTPPTVNAISPATGNLTTDNTPDFIFNYTDTQSPNASCTLYIGTTAYGTNASTLNNTQTTITASPAIPDGTYNWNITCTDLASNSAGSAPRTITIDVTINGIELLTDDGILIYGDRANNGEVKYRNWTNGLLSSEVYSGIDTGGRHSWIKTKCMDNQEQCILGASDVDNNLNLLVFYTDSWTIANFGAISVGGVFDNEMSWDIECEDLNGECLIAYETSISAADAVFNISTWNGAVLSTSTSVTIPGGENNPITWIKLYPQKGTDEIGIAVQNNGGGDAGTPAIYGGMWNGTTFTNWQIFTTNSITNGDEYTQHKHFDCAWDNSKFYCAYGNESNPNILMYSFNGTNWTSIGSIYSGLQAEPWEIAMCGAEPVNNFTHNKIGLMACGYNSSRGNSSLDGGIWNGISFSKTLYSDSPIRNNYPECGPAKGNAIYGGQNFKCEWENSGSQAVFTWVNYGNDFVRYATYKESTNAFSISNWSQGNQIVVDGANDVRDIELTSNSYNDQIFLVYTDVARDAGCTVWTGASWDGTGCNNAVAWETNGARAATDWASFDWIRYQLQPYITINRPTTTISLDNYSGITAGSGPSFAYNGTITTLPPNASNSPITGTEYPNACYVGVSASDDNPCTSTSTSTSVYAYQSYKFQISESRLNIQSIKIDHEGRATNSTSYIPIDFRIYVYNWTSDTYNLRRTVYGGGGADSYTETIITGGATDYVLNNTMYVLIQTATASGSAGSPEIDLNTDYISIETTTTPVWSGSQLVNATAIDRDGISLCEWSYYNGSGQVNAFTTMSLSAGYYVDTSDTTLVPDGTYYVNVFCNDTYNYRRNATELVRIDNTPPNVDILGPPNTSNFSTTQVLFSWNATDLAYENMLCNITMDGTVRNPTNIISPHNTNTSSNVSSLSDGTHYWNVSCRDDAGNQGWSDTFVFDIDTAGPTITLIYPDPGAFLNDRPISLNFTATDSHDILNCSLYLDGSLNNTIYNVTSGATSNFTFPNLTEGLHTWNVSCIDEFNFRTNASTRNFTIDYGLPSVTLLIPLDHTFNGTVPTLNYTVTDSIDNNLTCNITVNDEIVDSYIPSQNNTNISRAIYLSDGNKEWYVTCWDNASNVNSSATSYFTVIGGPIIYLRSPANNTAGNGYNITFIYNATDMDGVANCSLIIDGVVNQTNATINTTGNNSFFISDIGAGEHYWNVTCNDSNGLAGYSSTRRYAADRTAPQITLISPYDGQVVTTTPTSFSFTFTDSLSPNATCNLTIDSNVSAANMNFYANESATTTRTQTVVNGVHYWNVTCIDLGGLSNTSATYNFTVNVTFPVNVNVTADKATYQEREIAHINVTTTNASSGAAPSNLTTDFIYTNNTYTNTSWWNISWPKRKPIFINETASTGRVNRPILVNLTVPLGDIWSCADEIRVIADNDLSERAVNIISGDDVSYCNFIFNGSVSSGAVNEQNYHIYYGNHAAPTPSYPNLTSARVIFTDSFINNITANWSHGARWNISTSDPLAAGYANHSHIDGSVTDSGIWLNRSLNISQYNYINVSFVWEIDSTWNASGYMLFQISNNSGANWTTVSVLNGSTPGDLGTLKAFNISLNQSYLVTGFNARFVATTGNLTQDGGFDDFNVTGRSILQTNISTSTGGVQYFVERQSNQTNSSGRAAYEWNTTSRTYGNYSVVVWAVPSNTNLSYGTGFDWFTIIQDVYGPNVTLIFPLTNTTDHSGTYTFVYNASDVGTDIANCSLVLNNVVDQTNDTISETSNNSFTVADMSEGRYNWTVSCYDTIGNQANASIFILYLDDTSPSITLIYPDNIVLPLGNITFRFNATDNFDTNLVCNVSVDSGTFWRAVNATSGSITNTTINISTEATHYWNVTCYDNINNSYTSEPLNFTTSAVPIVALDSPPDGLGANTTDILLNYTVSSATLVNCSLILNGTTYETKNASDIPYQHNDGINNFTLTGMEYGRYNWTVICFDANNFNATDTVRTFQLDNAPPTISLYYPANGQTIYTRSINFTFNVTDNVDDNLTCNLSIDGVVNLTNISAMSGANTSARVLNVSITSHNWSVFCVDNTGFNVTSDTYNFTIESNVSVSLSAPANNSWDHDGIVNFTYTPSSPADFTPGQCNLYIDDAWYDRHVTVSSGVPKTFNETNVPEGIHTWYVNCTDATSRTGRSETRTLTVDKTDPVVTTYFPDGQTLTSSTVNFNWSVTDNLDSNMTCSVYVNGTLKTPANINSQNNTVTNYTYSGFPDGNLVWNVTCEDNSTRNGTSSPKSFTIQEPPTISLGNPPNGTRTKDQDQTLYFTPTDNSGNISSCDLIFDGAYDDTNGTQTASGVQRNFAKNSITEGIHNWTINCSDASGNIGTNTTPKYLIIDITGPNITLFEPGEGDYMNTNNIQFNWTASDYAGATINCSLYIDDIYNKSLAQLSGTNFSTIVSNLTDGPHNWTLNCSDNLNNSARSETRNFTINSPDLYIDNSRIVFNDTNPDLYQIINITANVTNTGGVPASNVFVEFWDGQPGVGTYLGNDTDSVPFNNGSTKFSVLWNITEGFHTIYVIVDPYNTVVELNETNNNATANISVLISTITAPPNTTLTNDSTPQITFNVTDYTSNNITYKIYVDGVYNSQTGNVTAGVSTDLNLSALSDGIRLIKVQATDILGRSKNSTVLNITIDTTPPTVHFETGSNTWFNDSTPPINFNITDSVDTNINYTIYVNGTYDQEGNVSNMTSTTIDLTAHDDGRYNITIQTKDDANNTANYSLIIYIDTTIPSINLASPNNTQTINNDTVLFNFTATDNLASYLMCNLTISNGMYEYNINATNGAYRNITKTGFTTGTFYWNVTCIDQANNTNTSETWEFTINPPDLYIDSSRISFNNTNPNLYENITIRANVSNIGGVDASDVLVEFWDNGMPDSGTYLGNATANIPNNASVLFNLSWIITPGYHTIYVLVDPYNAITEIDDTNNNATANISVLISTITAPPNTTLTNDSTPQITFNVTDYTSNNITYKIYIDGVYNSQTGNVTAGVSTDLNLSALSDGIRLIKVQATDSLNRSKNSTTLNITIDTAAPTTHFITQNGTWFNTNTPNISFNITDSIDLNISFNIYVNGTFDQSGSIANNTNTSIILGAHSDGRYNITIQSTDHATNSRNNSIIIYIDTEKPSITPSYPDNNANFTTRNVSLNFTVTDNLDLSLSCNLTIDSVINRSNFEVNNSQQASIQMISLTEGTHYWNVTCWDNATNVNTSETRNFNVYISPIINLTAPANGNISKYPDQIFFFNVTDDTGIFNCTLMLNGAVYTTKNQTDLTNNAVNNFTATGLEGVYNWSVICDDSTSFRTQGSSTTWNITIDLYAPTPSITTINYSWFNTSTPNISFMITDNFDSNISYTFYVNSSANVSGYAINNTPSSANLQDLNANSSYGIVLQATDDAGNSANSSSILIYVDTVRPNIDLSAPASGMGINSTSVQFNFTATDNMAPYTMCNLTISNGMNQTNINATDSALQNITKSGFVSGTYYWNVTCIDLAGNVNTSATWSFTITAPDLVITSGNISFNNTSPEEGQNITIYANVYNPGGTPANNLTIQFWKGDPDSGGTQINGNITITLLNNGDNITLNVTYTASIGYNNIFVVVDPPTATNGSISEEDESNNKANNTFTVGLYQVYAGNTTELIDLQKQSINISLYTWSVTNASGSNIFVTDLEASPDFNNLQAIGRNTTNATITDDFTDIDTAIGTTNYADSVNNTFTSSGSPKLTKTFTVFTRTINDVPIINSTSVSSFVTGILWDMSDGNNEYNGTQDLVFSTEINKSQIGGNGGIYDFEIKVPALLRNYEAAGTSIAFYYELK